MHDSEGAGRAEGRGSCLVPYAGAHTAAGHRPCLVLCCCPGWGVPQGAACLTAQPRDDAEGACREAHLLRGAVQGQDTRPQLAAHRGGRRHSAQSVARDPAGPWVRKEPRCQDPRCSTPHGGCDAHPHLHALPCQVGCADVCGVSGVFYLTTSTTQAPSPRCASPGQWPPAPGTTRSRAHWA